MTTSVTADLVIDGGTLVSPDAQYRASIAVKDGVILAIGAAEAMPPAEEILDATGLHILPGAIDVHVHSRPGYPQRKTLPAAPPRRSRRHRIRYAEHAADHRRPESARRQNASRQAYVDMASSRAGRGLDAHVDARSRRIIGFKLYMGNLCRFLPSTGAMEAFEVVAPTGTYLAA